MTQVDLCASDLGKVRFMHSAAWETAAVLWEIGSAAPSVSIHSMGLRRSVDVRAGALLDLLAPLTRVRGWIPDTMAPAPARGLTPAESFASILEVDVDVVEQDLRTLRATGTGGPWATLSPEEFRSRVASALEQLWEALLRPVWERLDAIVTNDISQRQHDLSTVGLAGMLDRLHPGVGLDGTSMALPVGGTECRHAANGHGVCLVPSVIRWNRLSLASAPDGPVVVSYPALGPATLWETPAAPGRALDLLIGRTRASILAAVTEPRTTTSLARRLGLSLATVSTHLTTLTAAGLVGRAREGRAVLYRRTDLGSVLLTSSRHDGTADADCSGAR